MNRTVLFILAGLMVALAACGATHRDSTGAPEAAKSSGGESKSSVAPARVAARPATSPAPAAVPALSVSSQLVSSQPLSELEPSPGIAKVEKCLVTLQDEAQVPAQEPGVLKELKVAEGKEVVAGEVLALIDDKKTEMEVRVAIAKLDAAKAKAEDNINERYATASARVAKAEYDVSAEANRKVIGAVPQVELNRLALKFEETRLSIDKARLDQRVAAQDAKVAEAERDAALENINRRQIKSPLDGVVVERQRHKGEWVQPGDVVYHVIRINRLYVEGYVSAEQFNPSQMVNRPVTVTVKLAGKQTVTVPGKTVLARQIVQAGANFLVRAEIENQKDPNGAWLISPGLSAEMVIQVR